MRKQIRLFLLLVCSAAPLIFEGCDGAEWALISPAYSLMGGGSGSDKASPVGADIGGRWSGTYENQETGEFEQITAKVGQDGDAVTITTSRSGVGANLTGTIDEDGHLDMIDSFDGEEWTSRQPATSNFLEIEDYTHSPEIGETDTPEQFIVLSR